MKLALFLFGLVVLPAHAKTYLCIGEQGVRVSPGEESESFSNDQKWLVDESGLRRFGEDSAWLTDCNYTTGL